MRKINENDYVNFTICGNGWNMTVHTLKAAMLEWKNLGNGYVLYGNKPSGDRAIIDSK